MPTTSEEARPLSAVIVAAGRSRRMDGEDKLWAPIPADQASARPLIACTIAAFQRCAAVQRITLVVSSDAQARTEALVRDAGFAKVSAIVAGGARRQDSVLAGLRALGPCDWVAVHDGARPLVSAELIERGLAEAAQTGASCCALPVQDTVREADQQQYAATTLDRSRLWLAQTPQTFRYDLLVKAHEQASGDATDDAALVEAIGIKVRLYRGSPRNLKVTTR
ncbi:MAG: 2-C-methyl-D-erythritol 4-phosphate cytidylyltransferase, partial [Chloroflexi bacterium]|nr:2-C-methyl-D-erythritol 4-phosphate cytidylyltransferase [Chloroflexota bacterium]